MSGRLSLKVPFFLKRRNVINASGGEQQIAWVDEGLVWAHVSEGRLARTVESEREAQDATHRVIIRRLESVEAGWRLESDGFNLTILAVSQLPADPRFTKLLCKEENP
ncbi:hypothetical protein E1162_07385 [Rhodobacteraceae bacterium RKSG542]|uniref:phage head closure protein n=1 Tax=Pseudovibrio flavus TaxID=2529854 RepID=UPI0012BB7898|nr:phage head closure protein [Pseudovibrio flavus]MTI17060.1 hypothetical protein [Pseudovibrio flavus]